MAINVPMPGDNMSGLFQGATSMQSIMDAIQQNKLRKAQEERTKQMSSLPFGGKIPPGAAGQTVGLEMVKGMYGADSPQYKQAKAMYDLQQQSTQSRTDYQNILANTADKRFSTTPAKSIQELEDIKNGFLPGTKTPMSPEQKEEYQKLYGLDFLKKTTDPKTRERALFSKNIDITLDNIDPEHLTRYSGLRGTANLLKEKAKASSGKPSKEYMQYTDAVTNAQLLAKQVRQFYGASITPQMDAQLQSLTNPTSWLKDPKVAKSNFDSFVKTLKSEQKTITGALHDPETYSPQDQPVSLPPSNGSPDQPMMQPPPQQPMQQPVDQPQDNQMAQPAANPEMVEELNFLQQKAQEAIARGANKDEVRRILKESRDAVMRKYPDQGGMGA